MPTEPASLTWTSLLSHWITLAKASVALPANAEGDRWREAVVSIISLHAVTHALADLDRDFLSRDRAVGQDKAELLIREHASAINVLWKGEPLPSELEALIADARAALRTTQSSGLEWRLEGATDMAEMNPGKAGRGVSAATLAAQAFDRPDELIAALVESGFDGDAFVPAPGVMMMPGSPLAFARSRWGGPPPHQTIAAISEFVGESVSPTRQACFRQVYRQFDFGTGKVRRDLVVPEKSELAAGQPLLVPAVLGGKPQPIPMPPPPGAIDRLSSVVVEFAQTSGSTE